VIYIAFDRLASRVTRRKKAAAAPALAPVEGA
jgi:hypothetical protein